nr:copia protein [Tanacetum cinerariifolium]
MDQQNPTLAFPILDTGKFKQWQFRIQQYFQHEHYALWEVIEFGDSYEAPDDVVATGSATEGTSKKKGRTVALTTEDMQKRKNDVKARTTLLLALPDEHQLRLSKYKIAQELWAAILKTFEAKNSSGKEDVNTASIPTASTNVSPVSVNIRAVRISQDTAYAYIASQSSGSQIKFEDITQIDKDDIGKKISIQGTDVAGFDKLKVECFNYHKMGHFVRECRAPRSQDRGRRDNYRLGSKVEEHAPKDLMVIDVVGWDWSFMANEEEDYALVADEETPTEFALMAKTSTDSEVFDNSLCFKTYKKNTNSLNDKITELTDKLSDTKNTFYHYKLGLSQVESRLVEFKNQEVKYCEKIRGLEFKVEARANRIECLTNELELLKKEKEGLESKLTGFQSASKDLDSLLKSQRLDKNKEGPSPAIESTLDDVQNRVPSVTETKASPYTISSKPFIKFMKETESPTKNKANKVETVRKTTVKYAELYKKTSKKSNVRGNISYISDYEPFDGGYVYFGQGGCKITGFTVYQMDVKSAFLYGTIDEEVLSNPQLCREFEALMHEKFQMSAMGELNFFLGLQVLQKEDGIFLSQDKYVGDILKKFRYSDNVWILVDCPKGVRPIGTKWVLKNKKDERGIVIRNKARLVAQGHTQEERIDYDEVFAPVARIEVIRLFLAYASFMGFTVYQMDVKSAFLYGTIDEEVYVMQPPRF